MDEQSLLKRAYTSVFLLGGRRIILQIIITLSNLVLARLLLPADFGLFALILYTMTFFTVFSDMGLGPALVQRQNEISKADIATAFIAQLVLSVIIITTLFLISPLFTTFFRLNDSVITLFRLQSLTFLWLPFKSIGTALLERNLKYTQLTIIETLEQLTGSLVTISFAFHGFGVRSFIFGALAAIIFSASMHYIVSHWPLFVRPSLTHLKKLLNFGIPVQTTVILGLFYGPLILLYMGRVVSQAEVGYFQIAAGLAATPLAFSEIIARIMFPLISRTRQNIAIVGKLFIGSLAATSLITLPFLIIFFVFAEPVVAILYGSRWLPIVPAARILLISTGVLSFTTICTQVLLALNEARWIRKLNFVWVIVTWILAPILLHFFSFVGMSLTTLIVSTTGLLMLFKLRTFLKVHLMMRLIPLFFVALLTGIAAFFMREQTNISVGWLILLSLCILGLYFLLIRLLARDVLMQTIRPVASALLPQTRIPKE